jgi:site-specific DNA recombinase
MDAVDDSVVKHLFVYNPDRLARKDTNAALIIRRKLFDAEVQIHTPQGMTGTANDEHQVLYRVMEIFAQYDNKKRRCRSVEGKLKAVQCGRWHGGPPPMGFHIVDRMLTPHPEESKWVSRVFNWYAEGQSTQGIKVKLDSAGVPARRGDLWSLGSIRKLLKNTHVIGSGDAQTIVGGLTAFPIIRPSPPTSVLN